MSFSVDVKLLLLMVAVFQHVGAERVDRPGNGRQKRSLLTFPPSSLFQITVGITSTGSVERNSAAIALAFQQNARLPAEPQPQVVAARGFSIYDHLRHVIGRYGFDGKECLGKMICQTAETPLVGGLLEDVVSFVLTPSKHRSVISNSTDFKVDDIRFFLDSESLGKKGGNCSSSFPNCGSTPLDFVSSLAHFPLSATD